MLEPLRRSHGRGRGRADGQERPPLAGSGGRKPRQSDIARRKALGWTPQTDYWERKAVVFAAVERGGRIRAEVVPNSRASVIAPLAQSYVLPGSMIFTDEYKAYDRLGKKGYTHRRIKHAARIYVDGDVHTQTIDGFFGLFKTGVRGAHHAVSHKWLQGYLNEWTWRYNRRDNGRAMFRDLLNEAASRSC